MPFLLLKLENSGIFSFSDTSNGVPTLLCKYPLKIVGINNSILLPIFALILLIRSNIVCGIVFSLLKTKKISI